MRRVLAATMVLALAVALVAAASAPSDAMPTLETKSPPSTVLGISYNARSDRGALAWFEPLTLRMLPVRKAPLGGHLGSWAFSADRAVLAIATCGGQRAARPGVRFVNARRMRVSGDLRLPLDHECVGPLTWLRPRRLLAVVQRSNDTEIAVIDPVARRVLRREPLPSGPWAVAHTRDELVMLLGTSGSFAPARIAVLDAQGNLRMVTVDRVLAGTVVDARSEDFLGRTISPGLAVDSDTNRAFLVPATGPVAEIDLETLAVSYHELDSPSRLQRFLRWLTPAAEAKAMEGPVREARWLGDGMLAVSGMDYSIETNSAGEVVEAGKPAGVRLIDTRSWRTRMLSAGSSGFAVAPGLVIAQGGRWDSAAQRTFSPGLFAFGLDGRERWRLHAGEDRWLNPVGSLGYGFVWIAEGQLEVVDVATGTPLRMLKRNERQNPWPQLLAAQQSGW
jgi:hypothetical protein